jgi:dihydroorotate dehydrogenase electron transfer subunit
VSDLIFAAEVLANEAVGPDVHAMRLSTPRDLSGFRAGAFLHILVDSGPFPLFRRAYSVLSAAPGEVEILYKVAGAGTRLLSRHRHSDVLSVMGPLGNSFRTPDREERALLVAGGIGLPPIYRWAQNLIADGVAQEHIRILYGARTGEELVLRDRLEQLGVAIDYATDDGSYGHSGRVTDLLRERVLARESGPIRYYACGPGPMLAACTRMSLELDVPGELALETPMPCGSGVCLGCIVSCRTGSEHETIYRRTCIDGPIFDAREVVWP